MNDRSKNKKVNKMSLKELNGVLLGLHLVNSTSLYRKHIEDRLNVVMDTEAKRVYGDKLRQEIMHGN